ncbi:MAG: endonuclease [Bacteroidales bacterium]|nr:endonuclease [Bacteroidales bacterium]
MKRIYTSLFVIFCATISFAQIPDGYYDDANGLNGEQLKTALYTIIDDHNSQSYGALWQHFISTDKKSNGKVWDMYSDIPGGTPPYEYTFVEDQCGNYSGEGSCYNREHSFPKSWFNDASPMVTDLFHIVPTDGYVNGQRSNYPFGETNSPSWTSLNGSKRGSNSTAGYSGTIFEPIDEYKGDFARIYFYMATRYENIIPNWENNSSSADAALDGSSFQVYEDWLLTVLLTWHQEDPVSQKEVNRNNGIYDIQYNRNPYVDHPEFVAQVWGGAEMPIISNVDHQPETPTSFEVVIVTATITDDGEYIDALLRYGYDANDLEYGDPMTTNGGDGYTAAIGAQVSGTNVYYKITATDDEGNTSESVIYHYQVQQEPGYISIPFAEDFDDQTLGIFNKYSVSGAEQEWHNADYQDAYYAKMSNYDGNDNLENEDWLISPAMNLYNYEDEELSFKSSMKDFGDDNCYIDLLYSTNYAGNGNPNDADWTNITDEANWSAGNYEWENSGIIDLSAIEGEKVYVAFRYDSQAGSGKTWQLDDISVDGILVSATDDLGKSMFMIYPNPAQNLIQISTTSDRDLNISIYQISGKLVLQNEDKTLRNVNISSLSPGYYLIKISDGKYVTTSPLLVY